MARKSRYADYYRGALALGKTKRRSNQKSIFGRLKELKGQEFVVNVPIEGKIENEK